MDKPRLVPARPDAQADAAAYMPRIRWPYIALALALLAGVIGGHLWKERRRAAALRTAMIQVHEVELAEARTRYVALRSRLDRLILDAASSEPRTHVEPDFDVARLRGSTGLYLRLPLSEARSEPAIARAAKAMEPDSIASCLGLAPESARTLYEEGEFLMPEFVTKIQNEQSPLRLRVEDDMLRRRIRKDLPNVLGLSRSDWFMLVLQEGANRRDTPVRIHVWDLRQDRLLFAGRVQSQGILLSGRILSKGSTANPAPESQQRDTITANDCSIASQLKRRSTAGAAQPPSQ